MGVGHLDGLGGRSRVLWLRYGVLPVVESVPKKDHVPVLLARRAALRDDVSERRRRLEEPELRLEVLLTVRIPSRL
jgi:hypothetical protein